MYFFRQIEGRSALLSWNVNIFSRIFLPLWFWFSRIFRPFVIFQYKTCSDTLELEIMGGYENFEQLTNCDDDNDATRIVNIKLLFFSLLKSTKSTKLDQLYPELSLHPMENWHQTLNTLPNYVKKMKVLWLAQETLIQRRRYVLRVCIVDIWRNFSTLIWF